MSGKCSAMFVMFGGKITSFLYKGDRLEMLQFMGEKQANYDADYWVKWEEKSGYLNGQVTDLCLVSDKDMAVPEKYIVNMCCSEDSSWTLQAIRETLDKVSFGRPVVITNSRGVKIYDMSMDSAEPLQLIADYPKATDAVETLPLISPTDKAGKVINTEDMDPTEKEFLLQYEQHLKRSM